MFDYIVVGAGSAGCVLASRLTEDPKTTVLLLEAGGEDRRKEIHIPAAFSKLFKTECDWAYYTEPEPHLNQRRLYWPRGKVLGGSSSINAMIHIRGNPRDYDRWREGGGEGWGFSDLAPYFSKLEKSNGGLLSVEPLRCVNPLSKVFVEAAMEIGLPRNEDFNGSTQEGAGIYRVTQKKGRRFSAAAAYLRPALRRPNLTVHTQAQVPTVLFSRTRATGVRYVRGGRPAESLAGREVILAGGAINSPQLLMLSGIGPADHLRSLSIQPVADLSGVGENLQDHLSVVTACESTKPITLAGAETMASLLRFVLFGSGPLTSNVAEAGAFLKTRSDEQAPDLQLLFGPVYYLNHGFTRPEGHGFSVGPALLHPRSRGRIRLRSADPFAPPAIEAHYLADPHDLEVLTEGVSLARRIMQAKAFDAFRGAEVYPGPGVASHAAIVEYIRGMAETLYHPVGTCKMGSDAAAVVDSRLRVRGVDGLRVVDASIMPAIISGNTNTPTIVIAERAADLIRRG